MSCGQCCGLLRRLQAAELQPLQGLLSNMVSAHIRSRTSSIQEASSLQLATAQAYQDFCAQQPRNRARQAAARNEN